MVSDTDRDQGKNFFFLLIFIEEPIKRRERSGVYRKRGTIIKRRRSHNSKRWNLEVTVLGLWEWLLRTHYGDLHQRGAEKGENHEDCKTKRSTLEEVKT